MRVCQSYTHLTNSHQLKTHAELLNLEVLQTYLLLNFSLLFLSYPGFSAITRNRIFKACLYFTENYNQKPRQKGLQRGKITSTEITAPSTSPIESCQLCSESPKPANLSIEHLLKTHAKLLNARRTRTKA